MKVPGMRDSWSIEMQTLRCILQVLLPLCALPSLWAIAPQTQALLDFKSGLTEDGELSTSWVAGNVDSSGCPLNWYGVTADGCKVVGLQLSSLSLAGVVGAGTLGQLQGLVTLHLSNNLLSGSLPADLGYLANLQDLDLSVNELEGIIPGSFSSLGSLVNLSLAANQFTGDIPTISKLGVLSCLNISHNLLSGPLQLGLASNLNVLDVSYNNLSGPIPTLVNLQNITYLDLSWNAFSGPILELGPGITTLQTLDLSHNRLSGSIPTMGLMTALTTLRITDNLLTGEVPQQLLDDETPMLQELDLSRNQLNGTLSIVSTKVLNILRLASNKLEGALPTRIQSCALVDLSSNQFSGNIVLSRWSPNLLTLDLSHNDLNGTIDAETFTQLFRMTTLNLSFNQLSGSIPPNLFNLSSITELVLSQNQFTGEIPVQPGIDTHLQRLDLASNQLTGVIPDSVGTYTQLTVLRLSVNQLNGSIPSQLSNLSLLQELDLSSNLLSGPIPAKLPASLKYLNVSGNNLSGTVPSNLVPPFSGSSFYPGNPNLHLPNSSPSPSNSSGPGVQVTLGSGHKRANSGVKIGLIVGCTIAAAILAVSSLLIYYRITLKTPRSTVAVKSQQDSKPTPHVSVDVDQAEVPNAPSVPRGMSVRSALIARARNDMKLDALDLQKSGESPMRTKWRAGGAPSSDDDSLISAEHPMVLKVRSPDRLAGDLFFLDASLLFTAEELSRAPAEVLGRSNHGTSYKATLDNGHVLTVKWLREGLAKNKKEFTREAKRFGGIKHPHVVSLRGYYWGPREHEKLLLSDFVSTGSLAHHLYERTGRRHSPLTWEQRLQVAVGIASGLSYLHNKHGVAHGNLKASNVLLQGPQLTARVADYSLHRLMTVAGTANQILNAGALGYRSPELAATRKPKPSLVADVYALGVILMELITGKGAGDIMSANCGAVDLPDWVRLVASEGRPVDCFDTALVGLHRDQEPPKSMHEVLAIALSCMAPQATRPTVKCIYDQLVGLTNA